MLQIINTVLTIDGNYFGHRTIHRMRITQPNLNLGTQGDIMKFDNELNNELIGMLDIFTGIVDNIIFTFDDKSWRAETEPYVPYYIDEETFDKPLVYKGNREELKEKNDIDWSMFAECMNNFYLRIKDKIASFKIRGLEGDDLLMLLSHKLNSKSVENVIFANDGDLVQLVNNKTHYYRYNKGKSTPEGTVVISKTNYDKKYNIGNASMLDTFLGSTFDLELINKLISLKLDAKYKITTRKEGEQVFFAQPLKIAFIKSITGDKKDNIFPILRWKSKTGTKNLSVTENMIIKVFNSLGYSEINDKFINKLIKDDDDFRTFFLNLVIETKQNGLAKNILKHFKHNWKINTLTPDNVPENYVADFEKVYEENYDKIYNFKGDLLNLSVSGNIQDSASNILLNSTPDAITASDILLK